MRLALYANASEVKTGPEGYVWHFDFFCIEERAHIIRKISYSIVSGLSNVSWGDPKTCNGSCQVWLKNKNLGLNQMLIPLRVARGARFLDKHVIGWAQRINVKNLKVRESDKCVLGQLFGGYYKAEEKLSLTNELAALLGFWHSFGEHPVPALYQQVDLEWSELQTAWLTQIQARTL